MIFAKIKKINQTKDTIINIAAVVDLKNITMMIKVRELLMIQKLTGIMKNIMTI